MLTFIFACEVSRIETRAGRIDVVDQISHLAQKVAPSKMVGVVIVDRARSFEAIGDRNKASEVLRCARHSCGQDWKVWLESVLVELRQGNWHGARELAAEGVKRHPGTGRLWSLHIQTLTTDEERHAAFLQALEHVPSLPSDWGHAYIYQVQQTILQTLQFQFRSMLKA